LNVLFKKNIDMRQLHIILCALFISSAIVAQEVKPVKNVIVMIPDGTSLGVYSAARWFKFYNDLGEGLNIDPYITGTVTTFSSNAPIGDSAPTGSAYATGVLQQTGNVAIHPATSANDLLPVDASRPWGWWLPASFRTPHRLTSPLIITAEATIRPSPRR